MLLQQTSAAEVDSSSSSSNIVRRFVGAVLNTKSLAKPSYIVVSDDTKAQKNLV